MAREEEDSANIDAKSGLPMSEAALRAEDTHVHIPLKKRHFEVTFSPLEFVSLVLRVRARAPDRGHLVLVPRGVALSDYTVVARLVAALLGTYMTSPEDYVSNGISCGSQFESTFNMKE